MSERDTDPNLVICDDCGRLIPAGEDFWFTDWKCPSEIYCDGCGPAHGFPHSEPVEDGRDEPGAGPVANDDLPF